jgi:hypothetical protein
MSAARPFHPPLLMQVGDARFGRAGPHSRAKACAFHHAQQSCPPDRMRAVEVVSTEQVHTRWHATEKQSLCCVPAAIASCLSTCRYDLMEHHAPHLRHISTPSLNTAGKPRANSDQWRLYLRGIEPCACRRAVALATFVRQVSYSIQTWLPFERPMRSGAEIFSGGEHNWSVSMNSPARLSTPRLSVFWRAR